MPWSVASLSSFEPLAKEDARLISGSATVVEPSVWSVKQQAIDWD
jgi:hypothetical protein